jgi:hypothetical protein
LVARGSGGVLIMNGIFARVQLRRLLAVLSLAAATATTALVLMSLGSTSSAGVVVPGHKSAAPEVASLVPAFAGALARPETRDEQRVAAMTPTGPARLVAADSGRNVYVSEVDGAAALCIAVENVASGRLSKTCGDAEAIRSGKLLLIIGGDAEDVVFTAGTAPSDAADARVVTSSGVVAARIEGGIYAAASTASPKQIQFTDPAGASVGSIAPPGTPDGR